MCPLGPFLLAEASALIISFTSWVLEVSNTERAHAVYAVAI